MIAELFVQLSLTSILLHLFPVDARDLEQGTSSYSIFTLPTPLSQWSQSAPPPLKSDPRRLGVVTSAVSVLVMDPASGTILFEKNRDAPRSIGSITKLMTAQVFLEQNPDLEAITTLTAQDLRFGGVQHVNLDDPMRVRDVLYASLVSSDNTATAALVRLSGMSMGDFVAKMNEEAASMGMTKTRFVDPTGLSAKNTSVVVDIAKLILEVSRNEIIADATTRAQYSLTSQSGTVYTLETTNDLLSSFLNKDAFRIVTAKTGFLPEAGYCLGAMFTRNDEDELLVVVLGSESDVGRFQDVKALASWTYDAYEWQ